MWSDKLLSKKWVPFCLVAGITLLVWGHTVGFQFVWDDFYFIVDLESVRSLQHVPEMFYRPEAQATSLDFKVFRPLRTAHYALLHWIGGAPTPQPWLFHLANVIWHGATAMILFVAASRLFMRLDSGMTEEKARGIAFLAALGFAVHPVVSEVVCWAKSLDDILAAFFTVAALNEMLKWNGSLRRYVLALFYFLVAVYSKESAVPFAVVPAMLFWRVYGLSLRRNVVLTSGFIAVAMLYVAHRHLVIGRSSQVDPISGSYIQTLIDMLPVVPQYVRLLCGVPPFLIDYSFMKGQHAILSWPVLSGLMLLALLIALAIWMWRRPDSRSAGFGLLWTALFLLPVSNLLPMMQYMAERFLYLPLIGWLIAGFYWIARLPGKRVAPLVSCTLLIAWAAVAWDRSFIWQDPLTLFVRSWQEGPETPRVKQNAINALFNLPHVRAVFETDRKTGTITRIHPFTAEQREPLLRTFEEANRVFPNDSRILNAMGAVYAQSGDLEKARSIFESIVNNDPTRVSAWNNLAQASLELKDYTTATHALEKAAALTPDHPTTLSLFARLYEEQNKYDLALKYLEQLNTNSPTPQTTERIRNLKQMLEQSQ